MAGPSSRTVADRQTSIQIQTSAYGICIPVVYGTNRIGGNLVWFGNFNAIDQTTKTGGKGMGGSSTSTTYTYRASAILALAEGTIAGIGSVWKDKDKTTLSALGLSLFSGADTQATWSFLTGYANTTNFAYDSVFGYQGSPSFVDQSINYSGTAYLASSTYDLGESASVPNHSFEVQGKLIYSAGGDALPHAVISDMLTAQRYGIGFPAANVDSLTSYASYCQAAGLFISPAYTQARPGSDVIQELCDATNAAPLWSGGKLKIIPYGDTTITGNGTTYTPNLTPLYDLADDDFLDRDDGPITITRKTPADAYNRISVQFRNRLNQYNQEVVSVEDQDAIERYGLKVASTITCDFICDSTIAKQVAQLALQRQLYKRNEYEFELGARYAMLEPMDIVTLTDPGLGMSRVAVRLIEVEEQEDGFRCRAEDLPIGVAAAATYAHDNGLRWQNTTAIPPQNCAAPIIFELPSETSTTGLAMAVAAGETLGDAMYGGCRVWLSLDGVNYREEGIIYGSSRYGTLSSAMAAGTAGLNPAGSLAVGMRSGGQMISGSADDMLKATTLLIVGDEYMAYQTAALTGANAYTLSNLNRGLYNTTPSAKGAGTPWVRVDTAVAQLADITAAMIGQTVYIKLTAFNVYGAAEQSLATVTAYAYTISGKMKSLEIIPGRTTIGGNPPSAALSSFGDRHIGDDGTIYERVNDGGILLGGYAITLGGYRPQLAWTKATSQPLAATIQQANSAATQAAAANAELANIASDNLLSKGEKPQVILDVAAINNEQAGIAAQATAYSITTELTAYNAAVTALNTYLATLTSPTLWSDISGDTTIVGATFRANFANVYSTRQTLLNQIAAIAGTRAGWSGVTGTGKPEDNADVTSQITGPAAILIDADYTGAVISSLPRTEAYKFLRNGVDLTTSTAWTVAVLRGTISASIGAATGVLSLNLSGGVLTDAMLRITATNSGRSRSFDVAVTKLIGSPPATGAGGTAASSTFSAAIASSTMVAASPELTITIGSGGTANLSASYDFETGVSGTYGLVGRWYRWNGSAYVAIGIEVNSTTNARFFPIDGISEPGSGQCNFVDTGLTAGSSQKYRFYARGADATNRNVWGSVSAVGG